MLFDTPQRRARLGVRHRLAARVESVERAAADLVGLHATDPVSVYLAALARVEGFERAHLEDALYERRSLVRILGMRRTMFVLPIDLAAVVDDACAKDILARERARLVRMLEEQGLVADADARLGEIADRVVEVLDEIGPATASDITERVEELGLKLSFGEGTRWAGQVGVSTRVLFLMATAGRIVRTRPRGTWLSSQYRWATMTSWLGGPLGGQPPEPARAELVRRWLATFGPGTLHDVKWWTGWTVRNTRAALADIGAVEVELEQGRGYILPDDLNPVEDRGRWVALLPALDPTIMGYKDRDWYLGDLGPRVFDRNGNAGPTIVADGRVVGGWAVRTDGTVAIEVLVDVDRTTHRAIDDEAARIETWLDGSRFTPRFRTPLEQELLDRDTRVRGTSRRRR